MKKTLLTLVALLLAFAMCFAFVGCSKDDDKEDEKDDNKTSVSDKADKDDKDKEDDKEDEKEEEEEDEEDEKQAADKDDAEAVAENYVESVLVKFDAEKAFKDIHDDAMAQITGGDEDAFIEEFQGYLDILADSEIEFEYEFVGEGDADLETMQDNYADIDLEVEDCIIFEVEIIGLGEEDEVQTFDISVVLIDGEWYLDPIETNL